MSCLKYLPVLLQALLGSACNNLPSASEAGLVAIAPNIYVEPEMDHMGRAYLLQTVRDAQHAIGTAYGNVLSHPPVYACMTETCYTRMGGSTGTTAEALDDRLVLSPGALDWHFLAHEWSHIELFTRLTPAAWRRVPQWFNEGLAVAISHEPQYSEDAWRFILANHLPHPSEQELYSLASLHQWSAAVRHYNAQNITRRARGEVEIFPVYTAAGHVVRPWLYQGGSYRLDRFIHRMNTGIPFNAAFQGLGR